MIRAAYCTYRPTVCVQKRERTSSSM